MTDWTPTGCYRKRGVNRWLRWILIALAVEFAVGFGIGTWMVLSGNVPEWAQIGGVQ